MVAQRVGHRQRLGDRAPALVAGAAAVGAAQAVLEGRAGRALVGEPAAAQQFRRHALGRDAIRAAHAQQPLRDDAVQRGDQAVAVHAHVGEPADDVEHVVGVHGRENLVAGERGLDGDMRGLGVADFADHDLVGVVPQDRAQPAHEGQPLLLVDRDL